MYYAIPPDSGHPPDKKIAAFQGSSVGRTSSPCNTKSGTNMKKYVKHAGYSSTAAGTREKQETRRQEGERLPEAQCIKEARNGKDGSNTSFGRRAEKECIRSYRHLTEHKKRRRRKKCPQARYLPECSVPNIQTERNLRRAAAPASIIRAEIHRRSAGHGDALSSSRSRRR